MCGGGGSKKTPVKKLAYTPNPNAVADTSNDYAQRRAAIASTEEQNASQTSTFGSELGG